MRIRIIFKLKNKGAILPFHHQKQIRFLLKEVLGDELLNSTNLFNYSGLKGQTKVGREGLHYFSKRVTLVFSAMDEKFINTVIDKLFKNQHVLLGDLILEPEYVEKELTKPLTSSCRYLCLSPLVVINEESSEQNKEFIHPTNDTFSDYLYESTMERMEYSGLYDAKEIESFFRFQIVPDKIYLDKIARQDKKFARIYTTITKGEIKEVRGYTFPFSLYADPRVQEFIYNCGFGELTENGFGMLDMASVEEVAREVIYDRSMQQGS
ncbi:CRISPR-associated endoribonuclease Cas6 [Flammeovirgaceae bacterium SG7u.111]|nr:CRISPR-associated endoribonuclease Cas6 [Flammeovirgaceae bacterium SG7u.132]WPO34721.1 CRISPR-associated endoribonuclease Cas6 [Flammeovirgaceae bacterium SG7u.111]